ncbi:hypothetical protein [Mitsuaria sp. 7]|uniref:hypothetical protein n=1 Tax=Mitsuaria sp. 7 TaxID=1658665 RepID=UPI0007DD4DB0|nr:hypothetical protein [Mitsuaria sp. 7]ANH67215.1 hypothetical protein ABE85_05875 [Mitsuaria sp. 7]
MSIRQIVLTALTAALSAGTSAGASGGAQATDRKARGQCHDLAKAGQHLCTGPSTVDPAPGEWVYGAKGAR